MYIASILEVKSLNSVIYFATVFEVKGSKFRLQTMKLEVDLNQTYIDPIMIHLK